MARAASSGITRTWPDAEARVRRCRWLPPSAFTVDAEARPRSPLSVSPRLDPVASRGGGRRGAPVPAAGAAVGWRPAAGSARPPSRTARPGSAVLGDGAADRGAVDRRGRLAAAPAANDAGGSPRPDEGAAGRARARGRRRPSARPAAPGRRSASRTLGHADRAARRGLEGEHGARGLGPQAAVGAPGRGRSPCRELAGRLVGGAARVRGQQAQVALLPGDGCAGGRDGRAAVVAGRLDAPPAAVLPRRGTDTPRGPAPPAAESAATPGRARPGLAVARRSASSTARIALSRDGPPTRRHRRVAR